MRLAVYDFDEKDYVDQLVLAPSWRRKIFAAVSGAAPPSFTV